MAACALDLENTFAALEAWPAAIAGHSFGGKVVLGWAHSSTRPPSEVWVLDSPPGLRDHGDDPGERMIGAVIDAMESAPLPARGRDDVITALVERGVPHGVAAWLSTNLQRDPSVDGYTWRLDLQAIRDLLVDYFKMDGWPLVEALSKGTQVHLVRGAQSDRWAQRELERVEEAAQAPNVFSHVVEEAGHWLHVDNPSGLLDAMRSSPFFSGVAEGPRMTPRPGSDEQ